MKIKFCKPLFSGILTLIIFLGTFSSVFASGGTGGGTAPVTFAGAYLTTISNNTSSTGENISGQSDIGLNPTIKLEFSNGILTYWSNNSQAITLADSNGNQIAINVSNITVNTNEKQNIFVSPVNPLTPGQTYTITINGSLEANNQTTLGTAQTVTFTTLAPVITGAKDVTIKVGDSFDPLAGVTATDKIDGDLTKQIKVNPAQVDTSATGTHQLTYTVTDSSGIETTVTRTVNVIDPVAFSGAYTTAITGNSSTTGSTIIGSNNVNYQPTIKLVFSKNVVNSTVWNINSKAITMTDSNSNIVPIKVWNIPDTVNDNEKRNIFVSPLASLTPGNTYTITISSTLTANNQTTLGQDQTITFTVSTDTEKPVISGTANQTIKLGQVFDPLKGITATDNIDGTLTSKISVTGKVDNKKPGTYTLTYTVSDNAQNVATVTRKITVIDNIKPVISGAANKTIAINSVFNPKTGVTAKDNIDGNLTSAIKVTGTVNTKKKGTYTLTYTVTDKAGNVTTVTRKITVIDNVKPVISGAANKTINRNSSFNPKTGVTAKDNVDGNLTSQIKVSGTVNTKKKGTYTLTYTVTDKSGNKTVVKRKVTVK